MSSRRSRNEGEIKRVGSNETRTVDVRVIAATNVDLRSRIGAGKFREDLFYRLNVIAINLPSLRERREDIPLLAYHFLQKYAGRASRNIHKISPDAMRLLQQQNWPGNVRELENAIEYAVVFCRDDAIVPQDLPFARASGSPLPDPTPSTAPPVLSGLIDLPYREAKQQALARFETAYFEALLDRAGGNVSEAARQAGLDRSNFRRASKRAGVSSRDDDE